MSLDNKKPGKWIMLLFLLMVVVGFTIPGMLDFDDQTGYTEPRICKTDADCYLMCQDQPITVLCSQNLCQQNACNEKNYYLFNSTPKNIQLVIEISGQKLDLANRSNSADLFVKQTGDNLALFSNNFYLSQILEKFNLKLDSQCLNTGDNQYCQKLDQSQKLELLVNNQPSFAYSNYIVEDGDQIKIIYS